jgi:DNA polymerase delta subunit 1
LVKGKEEFLRDVVKGFFDLVENTVVDPLRTFYRDCSFARFEEWHGIAPPAQQYVSRVQLERATHTQFIGFTKEGIDTIRIELFRPGDCTALRNAIQYAGLLLDLSDPVRMERCGFLQTYESDVPFVLRFSIDRDIKGMGWLTMRKWSAIPVNNRDRLSKCQIEVVIDDPFNVEGDNVREEMAPLRCLGFDCEMAATNVQRFVNAKNTGDALTQISCVVYEQGRMDDPIELCIFCLGGCEPLLRRAQRSENITEEEREWYGRARIYSFDSERGLLLAFRRFFEINSFDLVYGYNSIAFDMPWLFDRSNNVAALGAGMPLLFGKLGKLIERRVPTGENAYRWKDLISAGIESFRSNQAGTREYRCVRVPMIRQFDIMIAVMSNRKFRSYGLNAVGKELAKKEKIELDHVGITKHAISPVDIHRSVASRYCMWDTLLTMEVGIRRESYDVVYSEMARVTGVTMKELLTRGQTIKTYTQLIGFLKRTRETPGGRSFIIPYVRTCPIDLNPSTFDNAWMVEGENDDLEDIYGIFEKLFYEGGYVFEPKRGFYTDVIFCLDYKSLYPNIIISFNLCYTTYIAGRAKAEALGLKMAWDFQQGPIPSGHSEPEGDFYVYPGDHCFVKKHIREGILPLMLKDTLAARAKMRRFQKDYDYGTPEWLRYNAAQLAFKVTANSAYGFTGARKLAARYIAATVTFVGRTIIQQADRMSVAYGREHAGFENENVYGDTDSIMNRFLSLERDGRLHGKTEGPLDAFTFETLLKSAHMSVEIAKCITADFRRMGYSTIELEFEKIYYGAVFLMRKKYGVYKYEFDPRTNQLKPRVSTSGLETVRRDTTEFLQTVYDRVIRMVVEEKNLDGAIRYAQEEVAKLRDGQVPTRRLVYTGNFGKATHEYVNPVPHIEAVKRAMEIDPMLAPRVGQRISYVVVRRFPKDDAKESSLKVHQKSEVYQVVRASKGAMVPDCTHYAEKTIDAISRFFAACIASHMSQDEGQAYAARRVFYDKFRDQEAKRKLESSSILAGFAKQKKRKMGSTKSEAEIRRELVEEVGGKRKEPVVEEFTADHLKTTATTLEGFFRSAGMSKKGKKFKESAK